WGGVGKELEAAVAPRLLRGGAGSVVAMAYSVYAVAAAEFMAAFYERLFAGDRVADAVSAGRSRLARRAARPSPKGAEGPGGLGGAGALRPPRRALPLPAAGTAPGRGVPG